MPSVRVPQQDGEILIARNGDPPTRYPVSGGAVEVPDDLLPFFLATVEGSEAGAPPAPAEGGAPVTARRREER